MNNALLFEKQKSPYKYSDKVLPFIEKLASQFGIKIVVAEYIGQKESVDADLYRLKFYDNNQTMFCNIVMLNSMDGKTYTRSLLRDFGTHLLAMIDAAKQLDYFNGGYDTDKYGDNIKVEVEKDGYNIYYLGTLSTPTSIQFNVWHKV